MTFDLGITRRQRYVSTQTAANVTTSSYAQGGTITSYTYSGTTYIAHIFTASGIFTVTSVIYPLEFLAVAGGGGGGNQVGTNSGGGGGGGGIVTNGNLNVINRIYASPDYQAVTTATQANAKGGWVYTAQNPLTDFTGGNGTFYFSWSAVQQTSGGARSSVIPEVGADNVYSPQQYYMEIGITSIGPTDVAVALIRDGYPKDGYANMPYINLNGGTANNWSGAATALGTFAAGDTLQIAWDAQYQDGRGTYWWAGKNNTWNSTPLQDYTNVGLTTSTYKAHGLRLIFMCAAAGGTNLRGQFRSGVENKFPAPINTNNIISATTISNYSAFYTYPLGMNYASTGATYLVTVGGGGGVGSYYTSAQVGVPGSSGGDTVIYNTTNPSYYYSAYFSNGYITATNAAFSFGTGDFTIETWLYPTSSYGKQTTTYSYRPIFNSRNFSNPDTAERGFIVYLDFVNKVTIYTSGTTYVNTINTVTNGVWSHVAVARNNGVLNVWINGVKDRISFLTTASTTFTNFTNTNIMIGYGSQNIDLTQANFFTGYFSNYRIVKGVSVYNAGFQSLTAPLTATQSANVKGSPSTAISGTSTSLLMLTTSTTGIFYDSSLGTTSTLTTSTTTSYSSGLGPGSYSGSLSFNGTNQYLSSATSTAFVFGTSDFTVEYWVYYNALTAGTTYCLIGSGRTGSGYFFGSFGFIPYMSTSLVSYQVTPGATFKLQQWTHVAWVRNTAVAPGVNFYMNGSWAGYLQPSPGPTPDNITETGFSIGARSDPLYYSNAYVSNIRVVKGLALYTNRGNFTPPTTITSATQSTSTDFTINAITTQTVLLAFNTATIRDISTFSNLLTQTSGTVSVSTFAPFTTSTEVIRAFGGGGGGAPYTNNGQLGGSGGGAPGGGFGGAAIPGQGNRGGQGSQSLASGGGGFAYPGGPALNEGTWPTTVNGQLPAGAGGAGGYFNHSGAMVAYSGGGGGGSWNSASYGVGLGGVGGGGNGGYYNLSSLLIPAAAGTANSGGGGGGSNLGVPTAAAGGSGIVIFRYPAFLGDAARFPTDLTDTNLKNTTLLLSSNRTPTASTPVYGTTVTSSAFVVDYLIVGGGGGGGGAAVGISTGTGGGGGGAGGVVAVLGYTPPSTFNSLFYADVTYGPASLGGSAQGWTTATDFGSLGTGVWGFSYTGLQPSTGAKTTALAETNNYYFEIQITSITGNNANTIGLVRNSIAGYVALNNVGIYMFDGNTYIGDGVSTNISQADTRGAFAVGDVIGIAYNPTTNKQWFSRNGQWLINNDPAVNTGYPIAGTGPIVLQIVSGTTQNPNNGGTFRKSSANSYAAPTGFVPYTYAIILSSSTWTITVGSGGAGGTSSATPTSGSSGGNSSISFSNTNFIAYGGGGGGASYPTSAAGLAGGSGGGGSYNTGGGVISVGQGNVGAPTSAAFSAAGATTSTGYPGGGGGGAGGAGTWTFHSVTGGSGGVGTYTSILSTATAVAAGVGQVVNNLVYFAGGGAGGGASLNASSFGGGGGSGSLTFNGSSNYVSVANSSSWAFGSGAFTVECWFYQTAYASAGTGNSLIFLWHQVPGRAFNFYAQSAGGGIGAGWNTSLSMGGGSCGLNTWYHAAFVSNGTNFYLYLNGVQVATAAAATIVASTDPLFIGANNDAASPTWFFPGYITNVRIVKGTAVYTGNFAVPASPLTNVANTQLLLLASNDTNKNVDSSNNNFSITNNGSTYSSLSPIAAVTATNYTGGGGSGAIYASTATAGAGSRGVVVIRYPSNQPDATTTPGVATYINTSGYKTYIFTATGTITFANSSTYSTANYITGYVSGTAIINNRTIVDSSLNNIIINTATTTISQGTFSPYGSQWSTSFNGSTDYTAFVSTITTGTAFQQNVFWGARKSFTIEAWLNPNANQLSNTATVILGDVQPIGAGFAWSVGVDPSNKPIMYWKDPVNGNNFITATNTLSTGTWNHVAWVSNAGTATIFINGVNQYLTSSTISTLTNTTQTFGMVSGAYFNKFYNGSISNLRVSTTPLYFPNLNTGSSAYFNGSSYLSTATSTAMTFGTNNFTVEFWVYWITVAGYNQIVGSAITANGVAFGAGSGLWYMTTLATGYSTGIAITLNQWYHVAWVRTLGYVTLYLNGVASYTTPFATNITDVGLTIGGTAAAQNSTAYISNLRVLNGTALYSGGFTVPTPNLTNITNTTLLAFLTTSTTFTNYAPPPSTFTIGAGAPAFSGFTPFTVSSFVPPTGPLNASANTILLTNNTYRHIDSSTSSFAISTGTTTSVPKIQKFSPFSIGYAYNPLTIGGSVSLNGYSDFLYTTSATDVNFLGTATSLQLDSDFTIECWVYTTSTAVTQTIFDTAGKDGNTLRPNAFSLNITTAGLLYFNYNNTTSTFSTVAVNPFTWTHIAVTRYSGILQIWQNGTQTFGVNTTTNYSTGQILIGRNGPTAASYFSGFISDFRIVKGQSIYTNTFNPPVAPLRLFDSTTATSLLLNFNNAAIVDATMNHDVIVVNTATISSSVTKYNPNSIYFPGVVDYLTVIPISTSSYALGFSDFTVEMWVYLLPQPGFGLLQPATVRSIFDMRTQNTANAGFDIYLGNTGTLNVSTLGIGYITGTTFLSVNTWHHIALTKQNNSHNLFLNGIPEGITYTSTLTNFINPTVRLGFGVAGTGYFYGYIDDVRITRGFARYTYPGFLVPQKSLPVK